DGVLGANSLDVLLGNGDGTFRPAATYPLGVCGPRLVLADFNRDCVLDLTIGCRGTIVLRTGKADGTLEEEHDIPLAGIGSIAGAVAIELDGDGYLDLCVTGQE